MTQTSNSAAATVPDAIRALMGLVLMDPLRAISYAQELPPELAERYDLVRAAANFNPEFANSMPATLRGELILLMRQL
jgi:hypothetical protein